MNYIKEHITKTQVYIAIVIIIFIGIVVASCIYSANDYFEKWLICEYNTEYSNYTETLKFNFIENTLYEYERSEYMSATETTSLETLEEFFYSERESIEEYLSDDFKYDITITDDTVNIETYIKTITQYEFYNSYISDKGITMDSTIDEIEDALGDEYTCHIEKK